MAEAAKVILCPYCGHTQRTPADRCDDCGGFFDALSRRVSQQHMGPWFIRNSKAPFCPGCSYDVLLRQIQRGKITGSTILRGPTTKQFWSVARHVPGVAHLLGYCHTCGAKVEKGASDCPACGTHFVEPRRRDLLGIDPDDPTVFDEARAAGGSPPADSACLPEGADAAKTPAARATVVGTPSGSGSGSGDSGIRPRPRPSRSGSSIAAAAVTTEPRVTIAPAPAYTPPPTQEVSWMAEGGDQQNDEGEETAAETGGGSGQMWIWLLVGLNIALAAAVGLYLFFSSSSVEVVLPP